MWKTRFGRCIYESPLGIKVHQNLFYRWLTFGGGILQTLMNRRHPERSGLQYIEPLRQMVFSFPGDICLLGIGGAGVARALCPVLKQFGMVAVDNNQEVISIAKKYFNAADINNLMMLHENACKYVQFSKERFQHLIVDLHDSFDYPVECSNAWFFEHCRRLLKPQGFLAINLINIHEKRSLFQLIRAEFNDCTLVIPIKGLANCIVFAGNMSSLREFLDKIQNLKFISQLFWDEVWGYMALSSSANL